MKNHIDSSLMHVDETKFYDLLRPLMIGLSKKKLDRYVTTLLITRKRDRYFNRKIKRRIIIFSF